MTAPGVMKNATPAGALLGGLSFSGTVSKNGSEGTFEKIMETTQGSKAQDFVKKGMEPKKFGDNAENVRNQAKNMFTGKGKVKETGEMKQTKDMSDPKDVNEAISTMLVQIRQTVSEALGISEEELSAAMDALNMTDVDLLDRGSLQDLFLSVNQAEGPTDFLTNEALFDDFAKLMQAVEQTISESDLKPETIRDLMTAAPLPETEEITAVKSDEVPATTDETEDETNAEAVLTDPTNKTEAKNNKTEVKAETGRSDSKGHMTKAQGTEERKEISTETDGTLKATFIDAMTTNATQGSEEAIAAAAQVREIANQVIEQIKIVIRPEQTNMELQLNPEHLGRVHLTITEKEGMMTAQFTTQTMVAKEALESQMEVLKESLQNQGIRVEAIEVAVSEFGFERDRDADRNNGETQDRRRRQNGVRNVGESEDAPKMEDYINATDSSVDYSA